MFVIIMYMFMLTMVLGIPPYETGRRLIKTKLLFSVKRNKTIT
ncbi:hypothetical protein MtrunA17_Chr5g0443911 [Medicago truncatula]|uniref:Transmembrane protein n=1 Tax=Medicago truncatula TaxID=3880 RepID=A0A396HWN6_MEDTR|nr:hypothetical protein MtrunA17_Chr5g0443911 [Medicago truncatula]